MSEVQEKKWKKYITAPNLITFVRIVGAIALFFIPIETIPFYIVYGVCGVSDGVDGFVARRTGQTSAFGKKLDSAADLLFYLMMAYKMLKPLVDTLHTAVFWTVISLMILRLIVYIIVGIKYRIFLSSHSVFNKATGLIVFLIPYTIPFKDFFFYYSILGCTVAAVSIVVDVVMFVRKRRKTAESET